jgi:hypothetical protein
MEDHSFDEMQNDKGQSKRPKTLSVLCILTFIFSGLGCLSSVITPLYADQMVEFMKSGPGFDEAAMSDNLKVLTAGWNYYLITLALTIGSIAGAIMMWKLKKNGFHFYAVSNLALLFVPTLVLGMSVSWVAILLTSCFIGMYAIHLKYMK